MASQVKPSSNLSPGGEIILFYTPPPPLPSLSMFHIAVGSPSSLGLTIFHHYLFLMWTICPSFHHLMLTFKVNNYDHPPPNQYPTQHHRLKYDPDNDSANVADLTGTSLQGCFHHTQCYADPTFHCIVPPLSCSTMASCPFAASSSGLSSPLLV